MSVVAAPPWSDGAAARAAHAPLDGDTTADVVVVGAGATGLWTAYYLLEADPALDVLLLEAGTVGSGASGSTAFGCSAAFPVGPDALARDHGPDDVRALRAALRDTVVEVGGVSAAEEIDCGFTFGGHVTLARSARQAAHLHARAAQALRWDDELHVLDQAGVTAHVRSPQVVAGAWTPDAARLAPARLVHGLARVVGQRGVRLAEDTRALRVSPRAVVTDHGTVRCRHVVRATGASGPGPVAAPVAPVQVPAIATQPLPAATWREIGLARGESFGLAGHVAVHGHRTSDARLVVTCRAAARAGGTGHRGRLPHAHERLRRTLVDLFPVLADHAVTHAWTTPLGVTRDGYASVGLDRTTGVAWSGGYDHDGVGLANLAGRTLADLLTGVDSPLTGLPWVGHRSPGWPSGLRHLGARATIRGGSWVDRVEERTERAGRVIAALGRDRG